MTMESEFFKWHRPTTLAEIMDELQASIPKDEREEDLDARHQERYRRYRDEST